MDSTAEFLRHYQGLIVGLVASGAFAWLWRRVGAPMKALLEAQLMPNHGGSLVDKVNQIEPNHQEAMTHWKALEINQAAVKGELAVSEKRLAGQIAELGQSVQSNRDATVAKLNLHEAFVRTAVNRIATPEVKSLLGELYAELENTP